MTNAEIADIFQRIANVLAIQGENPFRIRAYERAAIIIAGLPQELADIYASGGTDTLRAIPGIGEDLAAKIGEILTTGQLKFYKTLTRKVPSGLLDVLDVEGMGPKRTKFVWRRFGVRSIRELERLCRSGKLARVRGWGEQSVRNIMAATEMLKKFGERMPIGRALPLAETLVRALEQSRLCDRVEIAGSIRRRKETIGDIDILVTSEHPKRVVDFFSSLPLINRVMAKGPTKVNALLKAGIEADLRALDPDVFGAALHYFTGSKAHNIHVRTIAIKKGLTVSEYGVFRRLRTPGEAGSGSAGKERKGKLIACRTEEDVFRAIGLPYIPPEIREDNGEVEAALASRLPTLIGERDIRGDLHVHSDFSDGAASITEMIAAAKHVGLTYIAITDHASVMGMVRGIKTARGQGRERGRGVREYVKRVRAAAKKVRGINVLAGAEVDILADGSLYLSDDELKQLDWVVGAIHLNFKQSREQATRRLLKAMENPYIHCVGHPTTRLIGERAGIEFDWDALFHKAKERGVVFELSASWLRLDLDDVRCRQAKAAGVKICINSDAHTPQEFDFRYGVSQARRGWIERGDVVNALPWAKFEQWLRRR